jgi:hypothetical protein
VRLFEVDEMTQMLQQAGFGRIQVFGDYSFGPYEGKTSPRMIFYAVKQGLGQM